MGVLVLLTFGGRGGGSVVQNRESPDFRSPEVGRYVMIPKRRLLTLIFACLCFIVIDQEQKQ